MAAAAAVFGHDMLAKLAANRHGPVRVGPSGEAARIHVGAGGSLAARVASTAYGIRARTYRVRTADGYLLRLVRLPRERSSKVVYFQHGLLDSASAWVASGAMYGLAARAWHAGYDVFLGNLRGTDDSNDTDDAGSVSRATPSASVSTTGLDHTPSNSAMPSRSVSVLSPDSLRAAAAVPVADEGAAGLAGETVWDGGLLLREGIHTITGDVIVAEDETTSHQEEEREREQEAPANSTPASVVGTHDGLLDTGSAAPAKLPPVPEMGSGDGSDLHLGHAWLPRSSSTFWEYSVDDHTLDVMAHVDAIRDLKAAEAPLRRRPDRTTRAVGKATARRAIGPKEKPKQPVSSSESDVPTSGSSIAASGTVETVADDTSAEQEAGRAAQALAEALADPSATVSAPPLSEAAPRAEVPGAPCDLRDTTPSSASTATSTPVGAHDDAGWGAEAEPPAYMMALRDVTIVGVGHSMGGCLMLTHLLHSRALRRSHGMSGTVLLSPAGLHRDVGIAPRLFLSFLGILALNVVPDGPFPVRSSKLQQAAASLVQDMKRSQGTGELLAALAAVFFGGTSSNFAFRRISLFDYPLGGTSVRVMAHGCQGMFGAEMTTFSFGACENRRRFGSDEVPVYRKDFGLIDVPTDFVAGELDSLIPPANLQLLAAALEACSPGMAGYTAFRDMGHLDFTLGVSDSVISHVLDDIDRFTRFGRQRSRAAGDGVPAARPLPPFPLDTPALCRTDGKLASVIAEGTARSHEGVSPNRWLPAAECARQYPFLNCYFKRELAFRGLDQRRVRLWKAFHSIPPPGPTGIKKN